MDLLIGDVFRNAARAAPNRIAAAHGSDSITFGELDLRANLVARAIARRGVRLGDRVAVWSDTNLDTVPVFAALSKLGAAFAPVSGLLSVEEAAPIIELADPTLLVVDSDRTEAGRRLGERGRCAVAGLDELRGDDEDDADIDTVGLTENHTHVLFFTSGSTGRPKGVVLSHRANFLRSFTGVMLSGRRPAVCPFPLFHMAAWTNALYQWQLHDSVVFSAADGVSVVDAIERHRAYRVAGIPAIWRRALEYLGTPEGRARDVSSLRIADTGTSATPVEFLEAVAEGFPSARVRVSYGSTEAGGVTFLDHDDISRKPGSCGVPNPLTRVRVDENGELWASGPALFDGYYGNPEATAEALIDGWYRSGDLAEIDHDGYVSIVGRANDVIRSGGETVAPTEVELVLADHPAVADVAVVGIPDMQWGEVVCAVLVVAEGQPAPTVEALRTHCRDRLATFKLPRRVEVVAEIPKTASTGQIRRTLIIQQFA